MNQETISAQEMAQELRVTPQTVYNYIERGIIPGTRVRRGLRFRVVVLRADFESVLPKLLSGDIDVGDKMGGDMRTPTMEAVTA